MAQTRRQFLLHTGCGALSASALLSGLGRFALIDTLAQSAAPSGYRALVCLFLFGGNDANNTVIPYDDLPGTGRGYEAYSAARSAAGFFVPKANLLQITPPDQPMTFGLHPRLGDAFQTNPSLKVLWDENRAAVVCNTGPLIRPLTRDEYRAGLARPYQLFSHSDQQNLWQTAFANRPKQVGWAGATVDRMGEGAFPTIASLAGVTIFSTGQNTRPLVLSPAPTALNASLRLFKYGNNPPEQAILDALMFDGQDPMPDLIRGAAQITTSALDASRALSANPTLTTPFPNTGIGRQLEQVAKLISIAPQLGVNRQIFFVSLGGFDTHTGQGAFNSNAGQAGLLSQLSQAVGSFYAAMVALGTAEQATLFTSSDFSRTFIPGGGNTGTDHAWGSHQFVIGGAVNGGRFYGEYPALVIGAEQDTDAGSGARGRWIPTTSVEQYAATLANWYGLASSDQALVFPNLGNFSTSDLGFMASGSS